MKHLSLSLFSTFQATLGDQPLTRFRSAKAQGLLIYLALTAQQAHRREVLAALFWPDEPEGIAKQNLRQALYLLRQLLADGESGKRQFLRISRATVQFNPDSNYRLDVADFLAALARGEWETAVAHYQGDLLAGFAFDSRPFDEWLRQEREQLHRQALDALNTLTSRSLSRADFPAAEGFARQQLVLEPWREEAHRQLMQALALQGKRSAALARFEMCRAILEEDLGVEPEAETITLAQHIREATMAQPKQRSRQRFIIPFIGRAAEFERLVEAYGRVVSDSVQVVTLLGKAGMGKTRLAQHFVEWAATQGADVLYGRSFENSAGLSYQPMTQLLRQRVELENAPEDLLSDLWFSQLTRILPELRDRYPDLPEPTQEENTARQHLFEAITRLVNALAERRPLVLFLDDWHWADSASLDLLHYAIARWAEAGSPILVLLTLRQEAVDDLPDIQSWLTRLQHGMEIRPFTLNALSHSETEQLVQRLPLAKSSPETDRLTRFSNWLYAETDGQPLFLSETLKSFVADDLMKPDNGSSTWQIDWEMFDTHSQTANGQLLPQVQHLIRGWLDRITESARMLLTAASVLTKEIRFDQLCDVAALDQFEALTALDELLNKQLLLEANDASATAKEPMYTFSHQKVSAMVYAEAGAARRRILHQRAFESLKTQSAVADCAFHALNGGLWVEAICYSLRAGSEAMALFAIRVAITHFETALQVAKEQGWPEQISIDDRQVLYSDLGRAYELIEAWTKAEETYEAMIAHAKLHDARAMECQGLNHLATIFYLKYDNGTEAVALLERALALAEQDGNQLGIAETELNLSMAAFQNHDHSLTRHHAERALAIASRLEQPQLMARQLSILAYVALQRREWDKVEAYSAEASRLYRECGMLVLAADVDRNLGLGQLLAGKPQEALMTLAETAVFSRHIENLWGEGECAWKLAFTHLELGHYGRAIQLAKAGVEMNQKLGIPNAIDLSLIIEGRVQRKTMSLEAAQAALSKTVAATETRQIVEIIFDWMLAELCATHALAGDWGQASAYARKRLQIQEDDSLLPMGLSGWHDTEALLHSGHGELARAEVARVARVVGGNRRYQLPLLRSQAVLAQWDGDAQLAISCLQNALSLAREIGLPGEEWPILAELGRLYAEHGEKVKAQEAFGEAAVIIQRLADTIDEEALQAGFLGANPVRDILEKRQRV